MKDKKVEIFWNKISSTGIKCSNLIAPSTETTVSHSLLGDSLFPLFCPCSFLSSPLWGNKKLDLPEWMLKRLTFFRTKSAQQALNVPIWLPHVQKPLCLNHFWVIPFSPFSAPAPSCLLLSGVIRNWTSQNESWKGQIFLDQNLLNR